MMRNNRPYSIENGYKDDALITDRPKAEMDLAMKWIRENIRPRKTPNINWCYRISEKSPVFDWRSRQ